jgi:hypothetical protein
VERLPITRGTFIPPAKAIYDLHPFFIFLKLNLSPLFTSMVLYRGIGFPFLQGLISAPVIAIAPVFTKIISGPVNVVSRHASPGWLPASTLAS